MFSGNRLISSPRCCRLLSVAYKSSELSDLTGQQKEQLREILPQIEESSRSPGASPPLVDLNLDKIRSRSLLQFSYNYNPPGDIESIIDKCAEECGLSPRNLFFENLSAKFALLLKVGSAVDHFIPSNKLHYIRGIGDVRNFYLMPVQNVTEYAQMARDNNMPTNVAVREHPARFHPSDIHAIHKGINPFPGEGGTVYGFRNKRLYREYRPKQEWYDYEEQNFDHEPIDAGMPWSTTISNKMDRYVDRKFTKTGIAKV